MSIPTRHDAQEHYHNLAPAYASRVNQTCERRYRQIVQRVLRGHRRVLELGSGSSDLLERLGAPIQLASDLSIEMLRRSGSGMASRIVAAGEHIPLPDAGVDAIFSVNVLEHVFDLDAVMAESARVLAEGGTWLAITPNGNWKAMLDLAERLKLKIPEGPHSFLTLRRLAGAVGKVRLEVVEHRTILVLPVGPSALSSATDRLMACSTLGWGFFQYLVARKPTQSSSGGEVAPRRGPDRPPIRYGLRRPEVRPSSPRGDDQ